MARPLRINYPGAWYHVMNRGGGYRTILNDDHQRCVFLELLADLNRMFQLEIHVYLLNVSRHIHLNPAAAGLVERASDYPWSSYRGYVGDGLVPKWLHVDFVLGMIGQGQRQEQYRSFVEAGIDEETATFFGKRKRLSILGSDGFRTHLMSNLDSDPEIPETREAVSTPSLSLIVTTVADIFSVSEEEILRTGSRGRGRRNLGRMAAIYITRKIAGYPLNEIASYFGLGHYASVSGIVIRC